MRLKLNDEYNVRLNVDMEIPMHDADILGFLRLMKFAPAPRFKFENSINAFIKFSEVSRIEN